MQEFHIDLIAPSNRKQLIQSFETFNSGTIQLLNEFKNNISAKITINTIEDVTVENVKDEMLNFLPKGVAIASLVEI